MSSWQKDLTKSTPAASSASGDTGIGRAHGGRPMTRDEMIERLLVDASEERATISCLRQPGGSTLLSNTTIDRVLSVLGRVAALRAPAVTGEADKQTPNEAEILRALSDALTGGNASTWEQVLHAAEQHRSELEAHDDVRRTLQAPQGDARGTEGAAADAGVRPVESRRGGDDRDRSPVVPVPAVGEAAPRPESVEPPPVEALPCKNCNKETDR